MNIIPYEVNLNVHAQMCNFSALLSILDYFQFRIRLFEHFWNSSISLFGIHFNINDSFGYLWKYYLQLKGKMDREFTRCFLETQGKCWLSIRWNHYKFEYQSMLFFLSSISFDLKHHFKSSNVVLMMNSGRNFILNKFPLHTYFRITQI